MAAPLSDSISNIIGVKIPYWLWQQFNTRSEKGASDYRNTEVIKFIANKTAWVRMVSSVNVEKEDLTHFQTINSDIGKDQAGLAKQYVLFGGTSKYLNSAYNLRTGFSGLDGSPESGGAYGIMGKNEIQKYGYKPMPGITNVSIETQGRLGSVRAATINFKCWDKEQLDIMDALYFKLGYTMFLEWGQTFYFPSPDREDQSKTKDNAPNPNDLLSTELVSIDPFNSKYENNKELIYREIAAKNRETEGNYDAMLGMVTNFTFSFNQEGGYDCTVKLISLGVLGDSIKVNNSSKLIDLVKSKIKAYEDTLKTLGELAERAATETARTPATPPPVPATREALTRTDNDKVFSGFNGDINTRVNVGGSNYLYIKKQDRFFPLDESSYSELYVTFEKDALKKILEDRGVRDQAIVSNSDWNTVNTIGNINRDALTTEKPSDIFVYGSTLSKQDTVLYEPSKTPKNLSFNLKYLQRENPFDLSISYDREAFKIDSNAVIQRMNAEPSYRDQFKQKLSEKLGLPPTSILFTQELRPTDPNNPVPVESYTRPDASRRSGEVTITEAITQLESEAEDLQPFEIADLYYGFSLRGINTAIVDKLRNEELEYKVVSVGQASSFSSKKDPASAYPSKWAFSVEGKIEVPISYKLKLKGLIKSEGVKYYIIEDTEIVIDFKIPINFTLSTTEWDLVKSFRVVTTAAQEILIGANPEAPSSEPATPTEPDSSQINKAFSYMSNLELSLRLIQLDALTQALKNATISVTTAEDGSRTIGIQNITETTPVQIYSSLFSNGIFQTPLIDDLIYKGKKNNDGKDTKVVNDVLKDNNQSDTFKTYAKYGFATKLLSGELAQNSDGKIPGLKEVDYQKLLTCYVLPYKINQDIESGTNLVHPVYVQFGLFLMLLNHSCTLYNPKAQYTSPVVYIDFNPNHNFCLTSPLHLSTDPFTAMIPYEGSSAQFKSLFEDDVLTAEKDAIKPVSGSTTPTPLFVDRGDSYLPNSDRISGKIAAKARFIDSVEVSAGRNRGRIMNILVNVDYLLTVIKQFAKKDGENKVFLKPLIEQVLMDVNKALGNFNIFRLSYNDAGNVFQIVDDQIVPSPDNNQVYRNNSSNSDFTKLPLFGKKSVATNLEIKTEVSTKLANMLAISANAPDKQGTNSTDASPFGFVNYNYTDRYMSERTEVEGTSLKINREGEIYSATEFNNSIIQIYAKDTLDQSRLSTATNYYIDKLTKSKVKDSATRASAMIPVSLNFTTDGIGGFYMGQAFTVDKDMLPYTYGAKKAYKNNVSTEAYDNKVGFVVTGLSHAIEGNTWKTSVKTNMIFLKNTEDYQKKPDEARIFAAPSDFPTSVPTPIADDLIAKMGQLNQRYGNRLTIKSKSDSIAAGGDIKQKLADAALYLMEEVLKKFPEIKLRGITGRSDFHNRLQDPSAHKDGRGADISIIDGNKYYVPWKEGTGPGTGKRGEVDSGHENYSRYIEVHNFLKTLTGETRLAIPVSEFKLDPNLKLVKDFNVSKFLDEVILGSLKGTGPHWHIQIKP